MAADTISGYIQGSLDYASCTAHAVDVDSRKVAIALPKEERRLVLGSATQTPIENRGG
jgi:hypothetical protein